MSKPKKKMIVKVVIDLESQEVGVADVQTNTNIKELLPMGGAQFLSLIFKQLSDQYAEKAKTH